MRREHDIFIRSNPAFDRFQTSFPAAASNISLVSGVLGIAKIDKVWPYELSFVDNY